MKLFMWFIVAAAGALSVVQAGANSTLNKGMRQPALSAMVSNSVGLLVMAVVLVILLVKQGAPSISASALRQLPWWVWIGGAFGAVYVLATVSFSERMGSGIFTGLSVTAAVVTSVLLDQFGLVGFKQHSAGLWRTIGCALMVAGLFLISKF